ncbi:hypothetical protein SLEP1_g14653 [Rubroshorea leprosula]|uniref:Uncharacterized protein n=1 Tax=Rubroshorea leprosula TaxID=152421 RepID=A0AAV5ITN2_9ROSI|nr:hypothetical protein SLEP1_g14653 [Rubroshorea leprosula]
MLHMPNLSLIPHFQHQNVRIDLQTPICLRDTRDLAAEIFLSYIISLVQDAPLMSCTSINTS